IVSAADAAGLHFQQRLGVLYRLLEQLQSLVAALGFQAGQGFIENVLRGRALALPHHRVDELRHQVRAVDGVGRGGPLCDMSFTRHPFHSRLVCPGFKVSMSQSFKDKTELVADSTLKLSKPRNLLLIPSWPAWRRIWNGPAGGQRHPPRPAFRGSRDNARPADPSRGRRG